MDEFERWNRVKHFKKCLVEGIISMTVFAAVIGAAWILAIGVDRLMTFLGIN